MSHLIVNCRNLPFTSTLGVAHALLQTCRALSADHEITFVVPDVGEVLEGPAGPTIEAIATDIVTPSELKIRHPKATEQGIEIQPHHFQEREFCHRSVATCFDLHVFDIEWKYEGRHESMQNRLRASLLSADAVMTMFPRTYFAVEGVAGITLMNLFLTESPLLLDTSPVCAAPPNVPTRSGRAAKLLYPAQLQAHKNHEALVSGVQAARKAGLEVSITCPGSDFNEAITGRLAGLVQASGVADSFEFVGRVSDDELLSLYGNADAVIVPSLAEGGAYVALEAIAAGRPVAVNDIESARMHVDSVGAHVIWFDASQQDGTFQAIEALVNADSDLWWHRNADCRARLKAATWEGVAEKWNQVIGMVEGRRRRPRLAMDRCASGVVYL